MRRPGHDPAEDTTREDLSGYYPTITATEQTALDDEQALCAAMAAERALPTPPDPDAARLVAEHAAQQRDASANAADYAPTDAELAGDEDLSAFIDAAQAQFVAWLDTLVEYPEQFAVADVARAA